MVLLRSATLAALAVVAPVSRAAYTLTTAYEGSTFFDGWDFYGYYDNTTHGNVEYAASQGSLAYVNAAGHAILKVDNTTTLTAGENRDSVKISSSQLYGIGTLQIWDAVHTPYGCSVWPAMWSYGPNDWPVSGEIDTFEGVNGVASNEMTLHTTAGCTTAGGGETGSVVYDDCSVYSNYNSGCGVADSTNVSYGAGFAANGGGVWATELAASGISVWFFPRPSVPADLQNSSMIPDPSSWGTPSAHFSNSTCSIAEFFGEQQLVVDISLCGDWAGTTSVYGLTCSGTCTDLVLDPTNYNNAYFEIRSVRVYTDSSNDSTAGAGTGVSASSSSAGAASPTATTSASSSSSSSTTSTASVVKGVCSVKPSTTSTSSSGAGRVVGGSVLAGLVGALSWLALA